MITNIWLRRTVDGIAIHVEKDYKEIDTLISFKDNNNNLTLVTLDNNSSNYIASNVMDMTTPDSITLTKKHGALSGYNFIYVDGTNYPRISFNVSIENNLCTECNNTGITLTIEDYTVHVLNDNYFDVDVYKSQEKICHLSMGVC